MKENQDKEVLYAFPQAIPDGRKGMTLRDYFAAKAMHALSMAPENNSLTYREVAERAYIMADSMLEQRIK